MLKEARKINFGSEKEDPLKLIQNKKAVIGVIGLGYVGLPMIRAIHNTGYQCIGFDTDADKIQSIQSGKSYIKTLTDTHIDELKNSPRFRVTHTVSDIAEMDVILICVPTPLTKNREPDMRFVAASAQTISNHVRPNQLITLESTTYPGTTKELLVPILEKNGLKAGIDFYVAYSPEREDPGNTVYEAATIPKVVGADDPTSEKLAITFYKQVVPHVVGVKGSSTAEAVKLTENIFRFVNIALVNELKCIYAKMGIDIWEVVEAAKTKPFGYMPFYPGPGIGGHCIPIDPFYLTWKAREFGMPTQLVELSGQINSQMAAYVVENLRRELDLRFEKGLKNSKILLVGLAYKKNINDLRESPALDIYEILAYNQSRVDYFDPHIPIVTDKAVHPMLTGQQSQDINQQNLATYDAVVICTDHDEIDYKLIKTHSKLIIDTRNAFKEIQENDTVVKC